MRSSSPLHLPTGDRRRLQKQTALTEMAEEATHSKIYVKNGFYKIVSALDGSVLTATWEGNPRQVATAAWEGKGEQEWKIKCVIRDACPFYLVRNELIRNNEVSKEQNLSGNEHENTFVPAEWNVIPSSNGDYFILNNGIGCLKASSNGKISIEGVETDAADAEHQWKFEYLYDIPPK